MDFHLSEEALEFKEMAKEFAEKRLFPYALEFDEKGETPKELIKECAELGYFGFCIPEEYGGMGLSSVSFMGVIEEFSKACAGFSVLLSVEVSLVGEILRIFGTEDQKKKYLPQLAIGERLGAYCVTEPNAGTDVGSIATTADDKGDHWLINGTKTFVTNAIFAGMFIVFARTTPDTRHKGLSCFIVDAELDGIAIGVAEKKCGLKASDTREVNFADVIIPKENLLGELNSGFKMAVTILNSGRLGISFQATGIAQAALDEAIKYSKERKQFGKSLSQFQAIQFKLADMATRIDAGRLLAYRAALLKDEGAEFHQEASMAKLFCSQTSNFVANEAVQIHGGYGYMKEYPVERYFRDARVTEIYEGTTEAQKMVISRELLKD